MTDDEYNRLFRKDDDPGWALWIAIGFIFFASVLVLLLPAHAGDKPLMPYVDEQCAASYACNRDVIWELVYQDEVISDPKEDLTEEACELLRESLEPQTEAFAYLTCRPRLVEREES